MNGTIVIAGSVASKPNHGGHAWVFLQYLLGFRRLGWDVLFLDHLPHPPSPSGGPSPADALAELMRRFGLDGQWSLLDDTTGQVAGLPMAEVVERTKRSSLFLNVMGFCTTPEILDVAPRRVFLDIDPGFPQMWTDLGLADMFTGHDAFVTIGENIGQPSCSVPMCGLNWITTPQPVVLDEWPEQRLPGRAVTSVASWRGAYGPVDYDGRHYGLRVHEFRAFAGLPASSPLALELALSIDPADEADLHLLRSSGWRLLDPCSVAADPWAYRRFIQGSAGELMVAKNMYVQTRSGWLSDRSLCYLASGRPVVAQDTGYADRYPTGLGLFPFTTVDEAQAALEELASEPGKHGRAARELAEACFGSDLVLGNLLTSLEVS